MNLKSRQVRCNNLEIHRVLMGPLEGKRPLGRLRRRWEDDIIINLKELGCDGENWANLAQGKNQWRANVRSKREVHITEESW